MKHRIPEDIIKKIDELFQDMVDRRVAYQVIGELYNQNLGVGSDQLVRSLLVLTDGNLITLQTTIPTMEPRDIIMAAEAKVGNPKHYFIPTFDQIKKS
jgi:hypothetical protein